MKPIVYIDMDGVLVDFESGIARLTRRELSRYEGRLDEVPGIFSRMDPREGALEAIAKLAPHFDLYVLSTAPWENPSSWQDKLKWVHDHFGSGPDSVFYKKVILTHHKNLNRGDYLIDDRDKRGADKFEGQWLHFGTHPDFQTWPQVVDYLISRLPS